MAHEWVRLSESQCLSCVSLPRAYQDEKHFFPDTFVVGYPCAPVGLGRRSKECFCCSHAVAPVCLFHVCHLRCALAYPCLSPERNLCGSGPIAVVMVAKGCWAWAMGTGRREYCA